METLPAARLKWENIAATATADGNGRDWSESLQRSGHSAVVAGKHVYVLGGRRRNEWLADALRFNLETRRWESLRPVPRGPRSHFTATQVNGQLWVVGGSGRTGVHETVQVLELATGEWHEPAISGDPSLLARCAHSAVVHPTKPGHILLFGGAGSDQRHLSDLAELRCDLQGPKATRVAPAGVEAPPRAYHTMTAIGHRCFVVGGKGAAGLIAGDSMMMMYDAANNRWGTVEVAGEAPCPRSSHTAALWRAGHEDRVVIFGGSAAKGRQGKQIQRLADAYSFKYQFAQVMCRREASSGGAMDGDEPQPCARASHVMVGLGDSLLLTGGYSGAEVYAGDLWIATPRQASPCVPAASPAAAQASSPATGPPIARSKSRSRISEQGGALAPRSLSPAAWQQARRRASSPQGWQRKKAKLAAPSAAPEPTLGAAVPSRRDAESATPRRGAEGRRLLQGKRPRLGCSQGKSPLQYSPDEVEDPDEAEDCDTASAVQRTAAVPAAPTGLEGTPAGSTTACPFSSSAAEQCVGGRSVDCDLELQRLQGQLRARVDVENALRSANTKLEAQVADLQRRLDAGEAAHRRMIEEYSAAQGTHSQEMAAANVEIRLQKEAASRALEEAEAARRDKAALEARLAEMAEELRAAGGSAEELRRERDSWREAGSSANRDLENAKAELQRERRALNELGAEHDRVGQRLQEMESAGRQHQRELSEARQRSAESQQGMKQAQEHAQNLASKCRDADQRILSLDRELQHARDTNRQQAQSHQERIQSMSRAMQQKEAEISRLCTQSCNLQSELFDRSNTLRQLEMEFKSLAEQVTASVNKARAWLQPQS